MSHEPDGFSFLPISNGFLLHTYIPYQPLCSGWSVGTDSSSKGPVAASRRTDTTDHTGWNDDSNEWSVNPYIHWSVCMCDTFSRWRTLANDAADELIFLGKDQLWRWEFQVEGIPVSNCASIMDSISVQKIVRAAHTICNIYIYIHTYTSSYHDLCKSLYTVI